MKIKKWLNRPYVGDIFSVVIGILLTFAFAPCQFYPLAILIPILLLILWQNITPGKAFFRGWLFGLGMFGAGIYWVFISIHTFGNASVFLASLFTVSLVAILALFPAFCGFLLNRFFPTLSRARLFYAFIALWIFLEWIRSWIFTGFPWLLLGYSQINSPLRGYAPILGVYGLSFLILMNSSMLLQIYLDIKQKHYRHALYYLASLIVVWIAGAYLNTINWTQPFGKPITVSLVQGNIAQEIKWSPENVQTTLDTYSKLTKNTWKSNIVVWPESAIPLPMQDAADFLNKIDETANKHKATFITGVPIQVANSQTYYNAVIALGYGQGYYLKRRLVPFGEYTPFNEIFGKLLDVLQIPMSDFVSGTEPPIPLMANNIKIEAYICYEIAFPELVLSKDPRVNLLLTVSNDAWFGRSIAQAQHLEMAQMRALENGRPLLFVSNNGITAIINQKGKIISKAPPYEPYVLTGTVQPTIGSTPWQRRGMDSILFLGIMFILLAVRKQRAIRKRKTKIDK